MSSNALKGKGAKFWLHNGASPGVLVAVTEVVSLTPPTPTRDTIDTTNHDSAGDYREFIGSLLDAGEVSCTVHWIPSSAGDTALTEALGSPYPRAFALDVNAPGGTQKRISGVGLVTAYAPADIVIDDKMTATLTIKVSGPITLGDVPA
jgi:predicted secreted protein